MVERLPTKRKVGTSKMPTNSKTGKTCSGDARKWPKSEQLAELRSDGSPKLKLLVSNRTDGLQTQMVDKVPSIALNIGNATYSKRRSWRFTDKPFNGCRWISWETVGWNLLIIQQKDLHRNCNLKFLLYSRMHYWQVESLLTTCIQVRIPVREPN